MSTSAQLIVQIVTKGGKEAISEVNRVAKESVSAEESALKRKKDLAAVWLASTKADIAEQKRLASELVNAQKAANADAQANASARSKVERDTVNEIISAHKSEIADYRANAAAQRQIDAELIASMRSRTADDKANAAAKAAIIKQSENEIIAAYRASNADAKANAAMAAQLARQTAAEDSAKLKAEQAAVSAQNQASSSIAAAKRGESNSVVADLHRQIAAENEALAAKLRAAVQNGTISSQFIAQSKLETNSRIADLKRQIAEQSKNTYEADRATRGITSALTGLSTKLYGLAAAYVSVQGAVRLFNETISTAAGYQTLERQLEFLTGGGVADATKELGYLTDVSNRYGTVLLQSTESYAALASAMKMSGISMQGVHKTYEALSAVAATYALSQDKVNAIMLAFTQIAGKGRVQSEELVRQLGQYIPALQLGAKAMGMSIRDFNAALKEGSVASADFLPKFSALIQEMYGENLERKTDTIAAAQNRLKTQFQESLNAISTQTGASDAYKNALEGLASVMKSIGDDKEFLNALSAIGTIIGFLAKGTIGTVAVPLIALKDTLSGVSYVMSQVGYAWGGIVYGASNSGEAILRASGEWSDFNATLEANKIIQQQISDEEMRWVNILNTATDSLAEVQDKLDKLQVSQLSGPKKIEYWSNMAEDAKANIEIIQNAEEQLKEQRESVSSATTTGSMESRQQASLELEKIDASIAEQELALGQNRLALAQATQSLGSAQDDLFISLSNVQKEYLSLTGSGQSFDEQIKSEKELILQLKDNLDSLGEYKLGEDPTTTSARVNIINQLVEAYKKLNSATSDEERLQAVVDRARVASLDERSQITEQFELEKVAMRSFFGDAKDMYDEWEAYRQKQVDAEVKAFDDAEESKTRKLQEQLLKRYGKYTAGGVEARYTEQRKVANTLTPEQGRDQVLAGIDIAENEDKLKAIEDVYQQHQSILASQFQAGLITETDFQQQSLENWNNYISQMNSVAGGANVVYQKQLSNWSTILGQVSSIGSQMQSLAKSNTAFYKGMFIANKAIAIAEAIINTEVAATKALAEGGYIMGIPMSTAIRALGYTSAALIAAQTVAQVSSGSYATGGYTGPGGKYEEAGIVHKGENVWTQEDVRAAGGPAAAERIRKMFGAAGGSMKLNWSGNSYATGGPVYSAPTPTINSSSNVSVPITINNSTDSEITTTRRRVNGQDVIEIAVAQAKAEILNDVTGKNGSFSSALRSSWGIG